MSAARAARATTAAASLACAIFAACAPAPTSSADGGATQDSAPVSDAAAPVVAQDSGAPSVNSAASVVSFEPGAGAGFGQSRMPGIVLGPPEGAGDMRGGTHVVSLGRGGRICVRMSAPVVDGDGADLIVFENPFIEAGSPRLFVELGEVSVSEDGQRFVAFSCDRAAPYRGCAGVSPVYASAGSGLDPADPRYAGGDAFDLRATGLSRATVVCVRDLETQELAPPSSGFDLDAIVAVHSERSTR